MGTMPVRPLLLHMAWPMMLSMFIQALYNMVDSMFVAQLSGDGFKALSFAYPIQLFMIAICVGTGVGVNALLSRRLGQRDQAGADAVAANGFFVYLLSWAAFFLFGFFLARPFMSFFTQEASVAAYGGDYLAIVTCGSLGMCMQFAAERVLQATGNPVGPMVVQGVGAVVNLILDPILIFGLFGVPRLEVAGAALATILGQLVGLGVGLFLVRRCKEIRVSVRGFRPDGGVIRELYKIGLPAMVMQSLATFMTLGLNKIVVLFDESYVFILGVYFKIQSFVFMPIYGLNNGLIPVLGYNFGARKKERILGLIRFALVIATAIMAVGTLLFLLFPAAFLALFKADATLMSAGVPALRIISLSFLFAGVSVIFSSAFQALGSPVHSLVISLLRQLVLILPAALLLSLLRPDLIWWAFPVAEGISAAAAFLLYRHISRQTLENMVEREK